MIKEMYNKKFYNDQNRMLWTSQITTNAKMKGK